MKLSRYRGQIRAAIGVMGCCAALISLPAIAQEPWRAGAKPSFLVATRGLSDPIFEQTVILMLPPATNVPLVIGFIINKPTGVPLQKLFPGAPALKKHDETAYFGGPVELTEPGLLLRAMRPGADVTSVFEDISVTINPASVAGILKDSDPAKDLRVILGRAQWTPEQLHAEMMEGSWYDVPAQAKLVFSPSPDTIWRTLVQHAELQEVNASPGGADDGFALLRFAGALP